MQSEAETKPIRASRCGFLSMAAASYSSSSNSGYCRPGVTQQAELPPLQIGAVQALDIARQKHSCSTLSDLIMADTPVVPIAWQKNVLISRAEVRDLGITVIRNRPLRQVWLDR